jgi:prephenate dehydrogenase
VVELWKIAGSSVPLMDPVQHDRVVAAISHLPHMVAYSLVNAVDGYDRFGGDLLAFSAGGFRDFTRIASSDPVMWRDIALTNREAILETMDFFSGYLEKLRSLVVAADGSGLEAFFLNSKQKRDAIS